jgi:hypothetical protein
MNLNGEYIFYWSQCDKSFNIFLLVYVRHVPISCFSLGSAENSVNILVLCEKMNLVLMQLFLDTLFAEFPLRQLSSILNGALPLLILLL